MSYIVRTIAKDGPDYSTITGPEINIRFKGPAFVQKVPFKSDLLQLTTPQGINLIFAIGKIVSVGGALPETDLDNLVEQIILQMP